MPILFSLAFALALAAQPAPQKKEAAKPPSPGEIAAAAPASAWRRIADDDLLIFTLANNRKIVIQLAPGFAPEHVKRMRLLANRKWWDDTSVYRVQDNYVAQWGDVTEKKKLPEGVADTGPSEYTRLGVRPVIKVKPDPYASIVGFTDDGWPMASDGRASWLTHCYGMVGVGRDLAPSIGSGAELYAVIGHAPRALDRNIALVGRVIEGIDALSSLERGTGALGFYAKDQRPTPIVSARLASSLSASERPRFEYLWPGSPSFATYLHARENREPPFFMVPAKGADICNVPVPIRKKS